MKWGTRQNNRAKLLATAIMANAVWEWAFESMQTESAGSVKKKRPIYTIIIYRFFFGPVVPVSVTVIVTVILPRAFVAAALTVPLTVALTVIVTVATQTLF